MRKHKNGNIGSVWIVFTNSTCCLDPTEGNQKSLIQISDFPVNTNQKGPFACEVRLSKQK